MKKRLIVAFILFFSITACISSTASSNSKAGEQPPMDKTSEDPAIQTIIALEQITKTPTATPIILSNLPNPWAELTTPTPPPDLVYPSSAIATAKYPNSIIYQGPGTRYKMACYVAKGTKLIITGRNIDSTWLSVILGPGQTCITMVGNIIRADLIIDPSMQFWILPSSYGMSDDLSGFPIITPAPTWSYYPGIIGTPTIQNTPSR